MRLALLLLTLFTLSACEEFSGPFSGGGPSVSDGKQDRGGSGGGY